MRAAREDAPDWPAPGDGAQVSNSSLPPCHLLLRSPLPPPIPHTLRDLISPPTISLARALVLLPVAPSPTLPATETAILRLPLFFPLAEYRSHCRHHSQRPRRSSRCALWLFPSSWFFPDDRSCLGQFHPPQWTMPTCGLVEQSKLRPPDRPAMISILHTHRLSLLAPPNCPCQCLEQTARMVPASTCPAHPNGSVPTAPTGARIPLTQYPQCRAGSPRHLLMPPPRSA